MLNAGRHLRYGGCAFYTHRLLHLRVKTVSGLCCYVDVKSVEVFRFYQMRMGKGVDINSGICGMWLWLARKIYLNFTKDSIKMGLQH